jgi:hypothetical protein
MPGRDYFSPPGPTNRQSHKRRTHLHKFFVLLMWAMHFSHLTYSPRYIFVVFMYWRSPFTLAGLHFPFFIRLILESYGRSFRGENGQAARTTGGRNEDSENPSNRCLWPKRAGAWPSCRSGLRPGGDAPPQNSSGAVAAAASADFAALHHPLPDGLLWPLSFLSSLAKRERDRRSRSRSNFGWKTRRVASKPERLAGLDARELDHLAPLRGFVG